jgi:hypothetical protein
MSVVIDGTAGITFPAGGTGNPAGVVVGTTDTQTLSSKTLTGATIQGGAITLGTAQASTSGTTIDFTSIPSWVKRISIMFNGVSTSGTSSYLVQLGSSSGGVENTGYISGCRAASSTVGFLFADAPTSANLYSGIATIDLTGTNLWTFSSTGVLIGSALYGGGGYKTISSTLDRIRITTAVGTDTFDAGSINIQYE